MDKWLVASVADEMGDVIYQVLEEAQRRDPQPEHPWVALVDGNQSQWKYLRKEAQARGIDLKVFGSVDIRRLRLQKDEKPSLLYNLRMR